MSKQQVVDELHRNARKRFQRRHFQMHGVNDTFQADLVEMIPYAKQNQNYKYILTVIDIFSKYAWAIPIKNKTGNEVTTAIKSIFKSDQRIPKNIQTDEGKEFYNVNFKKVMQEYHINHYSTYSVMKASIVERFNRTLMTKIWKQFSLQGTHKWTTILKKIINEYNNTKHRTIKMKPIEVNENNENLLLKTVYKQNNSIDAVRKNKFRVNDFVRISKFKHIFEKGYTPNWTAEIFKIRRVQLTNPVTYLLEDINGKHIKGSFYELELQKTKQPDIYLIEKILNQKKNKAYVKWLGFDQTHNSWINKTDII